jgi:hypothetical protein
MKLSENDENFYQRKFESLRSQRSKVRRRLKLPQKSQAEYQELLQKLAEIQYSLDKLNDLRKPKQTRVTLKTRLEETPILPVGYMNNIGFLPEQHKN